MDSKILIVAFLGLLIGAMGMWFAGKSESRIDGYASAMGFELPADAELMIPCIPGHGAHYGVPEDHDPNAPWIGPTYIVDEVNGRVLGIEYHVSEDALNTQNEAVLAALTPLVEGEITFGELELADAMSLQFDTMNVPIKYVDLLWVPGHPGYDRGHYDIHLYTVSKEEHRQVTCPA
jgi:hypothetical protein